MTFNEMIFKMFKADVKKYRLFILCNLSAIAILFSFISISKNPQFMDSSIVDPMISSNIYAPTLLVFIFIGLFVPYSQTVFIKARQKDYGILMTLGMTENEVRNSVIIENLILFILSLAGGLVLGTFLSLVFLVFIRHAVAISNININFSILSYKTATLYVSGIFSISLLVNIYGMTKRTIYEKIKFTEKAEGQDHYSIVLCISGFVLTVAAFVIVLFFYDKNNSTVWFISLLICILGSIFIFFNGEALFEYLRNNHYRKYIKNIFLFSDIRYYYGKNRNIYFVTAWLFFAILFFTMFSLLTYPNFINNAVRYHPFHMAYAGIKDNFEPLGDNEIKQIVQNNKNRITTNDTVKFVRNDMFTIFCIDDINRIFKRNDNIKANSFIYVYPYFMNDGYEHNTHSHISSLNIDSDQENKRLVLQDILIDPLFGQINCISDFIILVNKEDYEWISSHGSDYSLKGTLYLYNFDNWRSSGVIVDEVWKKLMEKNQIDPGSAFYKISSRIEAYNTALKSSNFLIFSIIYACVLLYCSAILMIHFKLQMEFNDEKQKYYSLFRIGIREIEIKKIISQKIWQIYFISFIYAIIVTIAYSYLTNFSYGYGFTGILYAVITSLIFLLIHLLVYKFYFGRYYKNIIAEK